MAKTKVRGKNRDNNRRAKKKVSFLTTEGITYVDWKNDKLLRKFMSERAKIRARRVTGNNAQQQKLVADAIKLAREMALVPYSNRVTTQRQNKDRDGRGQGCRSAAASLRRRLHRAQRRRETPTRPAGASEEHRPGCHRRAG